MPAGFDALLPEITEQPSDICIHKQTWNAFYETPLHEQLQQRGITGLVLAGVSTSVGVEGTAHAAERGYNVACLPMPRPTRCRPPTSAACSTFCPA